MGRPSQCLMCSLLSIWVVEGFAKFEKRLLTSLAPGVQDGWLKGRATYTAPSAQYLREFVGSPFGSAPGAGSCGLYSGTDNSDASTVIVPTAMRAAVVTTNPDFAGSCGRCYEVQCVSGNVVANYTADGKPYPISLSVASPPYKLNLTTASAPVDDPGRPFPGNLGEAEDLLAVQCWNTTNQTTPWIIQVTDSCQCLNYNTTPDGRQGAYTGFNPPCCTNTTHFNIDFLTFEQLAHPDFGFMNIQFRAVDCHSQQPFADNTYLPGFVNTTIVSDEIETGWGINSYPTGVDRQLQFNGQNVGYNVGYDVGHNATCFTLPAGSAGLTLFCVGCDRPGYEPFAINNTSGIQFWIKQTPSDPKYIGTLTPESVPPLQLSLGNNSADTVCGTSVKLLDLKAISQNKTTLINGFIQLSALFQNQFQSCIPALSNVTSIDFSQYSTATDSPISFCLANMQLLPTKVLPPDGLAGLPEAPGYPNCIFPEPEPTNNAGAYINQGPQFHGAVNVSASKDAQGYTAFAQADLQKDIDLVVDTQDLQDGVHCTSTISNYTSYVDDCMKANINSQCCLQPNSSAIQDLAFAETAIANTLAQICNDILLGSDKVCQAFTWDNEQKIGFFKGQKVNATIDVSTPASRLCNSPNVTTWILNAAWKPGAGPDTRALSLKAAGMSSSGKNGLSAAGKAYSVAGAVLGLITSAVAATLWLVLFNSHRLEKKMLVKQVIVRIKKAHMCNVPLNPTAMAPSPMALSASVSSSHALLDAPIINPLSRRASNAAWDDQDHSLELSSEATENMRKAAKQITVRCLQRWDGFLGLRAATDSLGRKSGIWRDRFESVRYASLLLAIRKYNESLAGTQAGNSGSLMQSWTQSNFKHQAMLITQLAKILQSLSTEEAQSLPNKDAETPGVHDRLCMCWNVFCRRGRRS